MFNETQLYDEGAQSRRAAGGEEGAALESYKDDEELTATFVPTTPEQIVCVAKELMQMCAPRPCPCTSHAPTPTLPLPLLLPYPYLTLPRPAPTVTPAPPLP